MVAFAARPVDHSTGPDVFLWRSGQEQAQRITHSGAGLFAGWFGEQLLISEISSAGASGGAADPAAASLPTAAGAADTFGASSFLFDPATATYQRIRRAMLLPAVNPTGRFLVYWAGTVQFDPVSGLWQPGSGELYFDAWSDLTLETASLGPDAGPTAGPPAAATPATATASAVDSPSPSEAATPSSPTAQASLSATAGPSALATNQATTPPASVTPSPAPQSLPRLLPVASSPGAADRKSV